VLHACDFSVPTALASRASGQASLTRAALLS
jgi:hypothetical protein